jgi:Na+/H+ antiporter NhaC
MIWFYLIIVVIIISSIIAVVEKVVTMRVITKVVQGNHGDEASREGIL